MERHLTAHIDGASRGNPGPSAFGVIIHEGETLLISYSEYFGEATNNHAEYRGLLSALNHSIKLKATSLTIFSDSELLVRQMNGVYRVKSPGLRPLYDKARILASRLKHFKIIHIVRSENREADRLASRAIDEQIKKIKKSSKARNDK